MTRHLRPTTYALLSTLAFTGSAMAANLGPGLFTDINADGLGFNQTDGFGGGAIAFDSEDDMGDSITFNGNDVAVFTMFGPSTNDGAGFSIAYSNGENGDAIPSNFEPVDPAFAAIGNGTGKLENGNVVRFSAWVRQSPDNPITVEPQIEPVFKLEFWEVALSGNADFTGGIPQPTFGDRIFDTDQNGGAGSWVDQNNNGSTSFGNPIATAAVTDEWRLVEQVYTVDDTNWGIGGVPKTVADVEEIRAVMFLGDFAGTDMTDGGSLFVDNALVEVFANSGAVTANTNPNPVLSEVAEGIIGDYNASGQVEQGDLDLVLQNWGLDSTGNVPAGWTNDLPDGIIEQTELDGVLSNWGSTMAPDFSGSAVPEPAALAVLGGLGVLARRRRVNA